MSAAWRRRVEPGLVELDTRREHVLDRLMQARHEQPTDRCFTHTLESRAGVTLITLSAAILAGGKALRFSGLDKSALRVDGRSILEGQLALLRGLTDNIVIVGHSPTPRTFTAGVPTIPDRWPGAGALGGLYSALADAPGDHVLVIACDMPFLTRPFLNHLVEAVAGVEVAIPRDAQGRHPLCGVFAAAVAPHMRTCIEAGRFRVREALDGLRVREIGPDELAPYDLDGRLLLNVNTPEDYARATGR